MPHQPCCSRVLTKLCQEVRTSPPTPLTLVSSCTFRSRSCSWSCSIESDVSVHGEVETRGLGERHTDREKPCEDRPTRQDRPGCPDQAGCSFVQSSLYNPKRWRTPIYLATSPTAASPLWARSFSLMLNLNLPTHSLGLLPLYYIVSSTSSTVKICLFTPTYLDHRLPSPAFELE